MLGNKVVIVGHHVVHEPRVGTSLRVLCNPTIELLSIFPQISADGAGKVDRERGRVGY